jgi:biotin carboxyl carrier protein
MKEKTMDVKEEQLVDFAVTARKYKTRLTAKYKQRKPWVSPSAYEIQSFIPGTVIKIFVQEGDVVKEGEPLLILEAMKMQNRKDMPFTAKIKRIEIAEGERVAKDTLMIELENIAVE